MNGINKPACPLITVAIPSYNHEKYVEGAIRSVLEQDYPRIELIIVDDGSLDKTWETVISLLSECEDKVERVVCCRNERNKGTCETFNRLCENANGDFFIPLASDDLLLPGALKALSEPMMENLDIGVVVGQNQIIDSQGRKCYWDKNRNNVYSEDSASYLTFNDYLRIQTGVKDDSPSFGTYHALLQKNHIANGCLIRSSVLKQVLPFTKSAPLEDYWLHLQLSKRCRYVSIPNETFCYRWHACNTIKQTSRICYLMHKTMLYESNLVQNDIRWKEIFNQVVDQKNEIFALFRFLSICRIQNFKESWIELSIGSIRLRVRHHKVIVDEQNQLAFWS